MSALPPVPKTIKLVIDGTIGPQAWANIFHFTYVSTLTPTIANVTAIATVAIAQYNVNIMPKRSVFVTSNTATVIDLNSTSGAVGIAGASVTGTNAGDLPASTCQLVKHKISRRYRGGHPRTYLPPMGVAQMQDQSSWTSAATTSVQTDFNNFISGVVGDSTTTAFGLVYANVSYYSGHSLRATPVTDVIQSSVVEQTIATQRRRIGR